MTKQSKLFKTYDVFKVQNIIMIFKLITISYTTEKTKKLKTLC